MDGGVLVPPYTVTCTEPDAPRIETPLLSSPVG